MQTSVGDTRVSMGTWADWASVKRTPFSYRPIASDRDIKSSRRDVTAHHHLPDPDYAHSVSGAMLASEFHESSLCNFELVRRASPV